MFLQNDIASLESMKGKIASQRCMTKEETDLAKKSFEMNEILFKEKVISADEYRQAKSALIAKQQADPQMDLNIIAQQN